MTKTYDASLRLASQQIAVGGVAQPAIAFQYDHDDLLTQAGALTLTPDPATGLLRGTTLTAGGGTVTDTIDYTPFGEVQHYEARHDGTELLDFLYERDALGRITRITETLTLAPDPPAVTDTHYRYDPAGRLYRVCADAACATIQAEYHYDANGNRIAPSFDARGPISATYDAQDRLLAMTAGGTTTTYTYTANGELETKTDTPGGTTTYAYDAFGNLRQVALPDGTVIDYVVDGRNRRIGKIVDGTLVRQWLYQDQLEPVAELDGQGNVLVEFVYGSKSHTPDYVLRDGQTYGVVPDHLGSIRLVVNLADGMIAQEVSYDALGRTVFDSSPQWQPFGFAGGIHDSTSPAVPGSGLVRFGVRDYDPVVARWTAVDPIRFRGNDTNLFGYVMNDPVNLKDTNGMLVTIQEASATASVNGTLRATLGLAATGVMVAVDGPPWREEDLREIIEVQSTPMEVSMPPKDPGEFLQFCLKSVRARLASGKIGPVKAAGGFAFCFAEAIRRGFGTMGGS